MGTNSMLLPPHVNHIPLLLLVFFPFFPCPVEMVWATQRDHSLLPRSYPSFFFLPPTQPILHMNCGKKKKKEERERETKTRNGRFQLMNPPSSFSLFLSLKFVANGWMELFPSPISHCYSLPPSTIPFVSQSLPPSPEHRKADMEHVHLFMCTCFPPFSFRAYFVFQNDCGKNQTDP